MDAFSYFLTSLAALNFLIALIAFLLGILLGWLIWSKYKKLYENKPTNNYEPKIKNLESELSKSRDALSACIETNEQLEAELKESDTQSAPIDEPSKPLQTETLDTPVAEETAPTSSTKNAYFSSLIESGLVKQDEKYGFLYTQAPDEVDDLTRIKGVAGVLNSVLNEFGVFTYRQIALWTPENCTDFADKISFKGRVERDNWVGQCKSFHEEKYGEKI